jgi:hypothetical protein
VWSSTTSSRIGAFMHGPPGCSFRAAP